MPLNAREDFEFNYGAVNFDEIRREEQKNQHLDQYLFEKKDSNPALNSYKIGLRHLVRGYIDQKIKISSNFDYASVSNLDLVDFLTRYEKMMDEKHKSGPNSMQERLPYEGLRRSFFVEELKEAIRVYDKPLSEIWGDNIVRDKITFDEVKSVVETAIQDINNYIRDNPPATNPPENRTSQNGPEATAEFLAVKERLGDTRPHGAFANMHMARLALEKAWKDRGILWRIVHPVQAVQLYIYKNDLANTEENFKANGFSCDKINEQTPELFTKMMKGVYEVTNKTVAKLKEEAKLKSTVLDKKIAKEDATVSLTSNKSEEKEQDNELLNLKNDVSYPAPAEIAPPHTESKSIGIPELNNH